MSLPKRFSGVPRKAIKLILTEEMFWKIHNLESMKGSPQEKIRTILERYLSSNHKGLKIERVWAMPNKWTFQIKPIKKLIDEEIDDGRWIDPFCGSSQRATVSNDLNPEVKADYHMDALEFLKMFPDCSFNGAHFDPPFSPRQFKECYDYLKLKAPSQVFNAGYLAKCRDQIARLLTVNSKVISCGWNSNGMGKSRGFEINRILIVAHGSGHNDTIVTVETKVQSTLDEEILEKRRDLQ